MEKTRKNKVKNFFFLVGFCGDENAIFLVWVFTMDFQRPTKLE